MLVPAVSAATFLVLEELVALSQTCATAVEICLRSAGSGACGATDGVGLLVPGPPVLSPTAGQSLRI